MSSCTNRQNTNIKPPQTKVVKTTEYYKNGTSIETEAEYNSFVAKTNKKHEGSDTKVVPVIISQTQSGDSTIYSYDLDIRTIGNKMIGKQLPDFNFKDIDGKLVSLKELKGKPIIINLWFVECPPCIAEMPALNSIKEKYSNSDIQFLSMTYEPKERVKKFLLKTKINYRIIPDIGGYCNILTSNFPQTIFINRQGIITDIQNGMIPIYDKQLKKTTNKMDETDFMNSLNAIK